MKILENIKNLNNGIITIYGQRGSGKTLLTLFISINKLNVKKHITYLFSDLYSTIMHAKNIHQNLPIEFIQIYSIDDIESLIVERGKKDIGNSIIIVDRISIFKLEPYDSINSYRKLSILLALMHEDAIIQNNLYILNYSSEIMEKSFNIIDYFTNILIKTELKEDRIHIKFFNKDVEYEYEEFLPIKDILSKIYV